MDDTPTLPAELLGWHTIDAAFDLEIIAAAPKDTRWVTADERDLGRLFISQERLACPKGEFPVSAFGRPQPSYFAFELLRNDRSHQAHIYVAAEAWQLMIHFATGHVTYTVRRPESKTEASDAGGRAPDA